MSNVAHREKTINLGNMSDTLRNAANAVRVQIETVEKDYIGRPWLEVAEAVSPIVERALCGFKGIGYDFSMDTEKRLQVILFEEKNISNATIL